MKHKRFDFFFFPFLFLVELCIKPILDVGRQGDELNQKLLHTCLALICPLCSPSLSLCQKQRLVVFFMSLESQTTVCAFNCAQTPIFSGSVRRSRDDRVSVGDRCSDGPVPLWFCGSFASERAASQVPRNKKHPRKCWNTYYTKGNTFVP